MVKICLISVDGNNIILPLRYLSTSLKKKGHTVRIIALPEKFDYEKDYLCCPEHVLYVPYHERIMKQLTPLVNGFDLIGITSIAMSKKRAAQVINHLKPLKIPIIWGGKYCTTSPEESIKICPMICVGDGEQAIVQLAEALDNGQPFDTTTPNIWFKKGDAIFRNPIGNATPFGEMVLDYSMDNKFTIEKNKIVPMSYFHLTHQIIYQTMRGCAFKCSFCTNNVFLEKYKGKGRYFEMKEPKLVIEELINIKKDYKTLKWIWFVDDDFFLRPVKELEEFAALYKKHIGIPFKVYGSPKTIVEEKLKIAVDAGLTSIDVGVQTSSQRVSREVYNRFFSTDEISRMISLLHSYLRERKLESVHLQFISNNPYETTEDIKDSIRTILHVPPLFNIEVFNLVLFPGTDLYKKSLADNIINDDEKTEECVYVDNKVFRRKENNVYYNQVLQCLFGKTSRLWRGTIPVFLLKFLMIDSLRPINDMFMRFYFPLQRFWGPYKDIDILKFQEIL